MKKHTDIGVIIKTKTLNIYQWFLRLLLQFGFKVLNLAFICNGLALTVVCIGPILQRAIRFHKVLSCGLKGQVACISEKQRLPVKTSANASFYGEKLRPCEVLRPTREKLRNISAY